jgi:hypothetical protein
VNRRHGFGKLGGIEHFLSLHSGTRCYGMFPIGANSHAVDSHAHRLVMLLQCRRLSGKSWRLSANFPPYVPLFSERKLFGSDDQSPLLSPPE